MIESKPVKAPDTSSLTLVKHSPNERLISQLEWLLKQAKTGEITSLYTVAGWRGDTVSSGYMHGGFISRRMLGELACLNQKLIELSEE